MERYDYARCNGLNWCTNDGMSGYCNVLGNRICLMIERPHGVDTWKEFNFVHESIELDNFVRDYDFTICPRDEKSQDFHEGDIVVKDADLSFWEILHVVNDMTFLIASYSATKIDSIREVLAVEFFVLCRDYHYNSTRYEDSLKSARKLGDVRPLPLNTICLWRDEEDGEWQIGNFEGYGNTNARPYIVDGKERQSAIPYNEKTWHLALTDLPCPDDKEEDEEED